MDAKQIVVTGAGPAGMMAAIRAGQLQGRVTLFEKNNSAGRKLLLSGKGRSNLTNACELEAFYPRFAKNGEFLRDAFKKFSNRDLMEFFKSRGLPLKVERQLRVFPVSDRSASVLRVLENELNKSKVEMICRAAVRDLATQGNAVKGVVLADGKFVAAARVILATGGVSYPFTGSTGDGIGIAAKLGHRIVALRPGLVALDVREGYAAGLEGLTLKNIRLRFSTGRKELVSGIGELLFTARGVSGPLVLSASAAIGEWLQAGKVRLEIDLKPALSQEQLDARLLREFKLNPGKNISNVLKALLPVRLVAVFIEISGISGNKKTNQITAAERRKLLAFLKGLPFEIAATRPMAEAMVTHGGVSLKDIDPRTMESRLVRGLYFCGEMIDVAADTGGFNLQVAFSTGYLAGESAAQGAG